MTDKINAINRRELLAFSAAGLVGCGGRVVAPATAKQRKNVVIVLTDDQRFDMLGFLQPWLRTPNLNAMASLGAWFTNAFVTTSLCCPSRATMLTGLFAHEHGVLNNQSELDPSLQTFSSIARDAGVHTAFVGKWHMGGDQARPRPHWDHWVSFPGQGFYAYPGSGGRRPRERSFNVNGRRVESEGYVTDLITDHAIEFLRERPKDKPFCLVVSHKACHAPFVPAERHKFLLEDAPVPSVLENTDEAYRGIPRWIRDLRKSIFGVETLYNGRWQSFDQWFRDYHRVLLAVDEGLGRVRAELQAQGLEGETVVLFTSDNGFMLGDKGVLDKRAAYEDSIRIPLLAVGPTISHIRVDAQASTLDLARTVLDFLDVEPVDSMRGRSLRPMMTAPDDHELARNQQGPNPATEGKDGGPPVQASVRVVPLNEREELLYTYFHEQAFPDIPTIIALRNANYKLVTYHGIASRDELYHLPSDPTERNNLVKQRPRVVQRMRERLHSKAREAGLSLEPNWKRASPPEASPSE